MGHQEDRTTGCGRQIQDPANPSRTVSCPGTKTTVYVYDDNGACISQSMWPCTNCAG